MSGQSVGYTATGNLASLGDRSYEYDAYTQLRAARNQGKLIAAFRCDAVGGRPRAIDRSHPRNPTRHLIAGDFDWDATAPTRSCVQGAPRGAGRGASTAAWLGVKGVD